MSGVPSDSNAAERSSAGTSTDTLPSPHHPNAHVELPVEEEARRLRRETGGKLSGHPGLGVSLFCAGDEDQHIYRWRGTTVDHLHRYKVVLEALQKGLLTSCWGEASCRGCIEGREHIQRMLSGPHSFEAKDIPGIVLI